MIHTLRTLALLPILSLPIGVQAEFKAGAAAVDITPATLPVLVNGGMLTRSVDTVKTRLHARALALANEREEVVIVVVDSCMIGRPLLDEAKSLAAKATGIATNRMLLSATHAHSAPSAMACLGTDADPRYIPQLRAQIVEAITTAHRNLEPAQVGWTQGNAAAFTALRRWIRRPDRLADDPFGNPTVRANMHAGSNWDDVTGESGPEDPDLTLISIQSTAGRPLAVLANFSMHYFGDDNLSADYFGLFCQGLEARLANPTAAGHPPFVGILSHGCSGDIYRVDYKIPAKDRPNPTLRDYTAGLLDIAMAALTNVSHRADIDLAMAEQRLPLRYRVPDKQRLEWAQRVLAGMENRPPKTTVEVYAREQVLLHEMQRTEVVVQALRLGDIAIATTPTETYAITGLKLKAASPLPQTMVIELANGGDGYIPPPEQHAFGGYNTWPARSAGLEVSAEPKILEAALGLLERVCAKPRRPWKLPEGPAATTLLATHPVAYWRLNEVTGPHALDATPHGHHAVYEPAITYYLEGPLSQDFCGEDTLNRAPHFVGGRLRTVFPSMGPRFSVSLWIWNGMPNEGRPVSGWFFSRGHDHGVGPGSLHLGVGGSAGPAGRLMLLQGGAPQLITGGNALLPRWEWHHVLLVRDTDRIQVFLDGALDLEAPVLAHDPSGIDTFFFGGRSDNDSNWEGRLDEITFYDRPITPQVGWRR